MPGKRDHGWTHRASLVAFFDRRGLGAGALAQDKPLELTRPASHSAQQACRGGRALNDHPKLNKPLTFPLAMCVFPGGLCGAVPP